jgi:dUTPase
MTISRDVVIESGAFAALPTNVAIALPDDVWALVVGRASTFYKRGLIINIGVIDPGYRGEVMALTHNVGTDVMIAHKGERLFQVIPMRSVDLKWEFIKRGKNLPVSHRGASEVGSTGGYITTAIDPKP